MDSEAAPTIETTEVSRPDAQEDNAGQPGDAAGDATKEKTPVKAGGKKSKRQFRTLEDAYNPTAYTQPVKGTGGKGKKGKGEDDGRKGKGKGAYYQEGGEALAKQGPADGDAAQSPASTAGPGPVAVDGSDPSQQKGGSKDKKRPPNGVGGKNNNRAEGAKGGKGSSNPGGGGGGGGQAGQQGPGGGGGKPQQQQQQQQPPRKGSGGQGGKGPRGPLGSPDIMMDAGLEVEGPRTPGPQQRPLAPVAAKGGLPGGMVGIQQMQMPMGFMPMNMGYGQQPMGYGMPMPGGQYMMPYGAQGMPYMVMGSPQGGPFMPAPAQVAQAQPALTPGEQANMVKKVKEQIEYYFGVDNLLKDVFLRKHMTDEGWLPVTLIASFSRVAQMTRDMGVLMEALTTSQIIETDAQRQNIRLRNDWPRWILAPPQAGAAGAAPAATTEPAIRSTP